MRRWLLSALVATTLAVPAYAVQGSAKPKPADEQAKQTQQAVKDARKHAKKADEQPHEQARKADEEGRKAAKKAQKGAVGTSGIANQFRGLDKNGNGIIERAEWRGDDRAFAEQDWNGDGVLAGDEVKAGAKRPGKR